MGLIGIDPNSELPHPSVDEGPLPVVDGNNGGGDGGRGDNAGNIGEDKDDEEDGAVAGPTVEAYVELAKKSRTSLLLDTREAR
jgi:hypothetical protein